MEASVATVPVQTAVFKRPIFVLLCENSRDGFPDSTPSNLVPGDRAENPSGRNQFVTRVVTVALAVATIAPGVRSAGAPQQFVPGDGPKNVRKHL